MVLVNRPISPRPVCLLLSVLLGAGLALAQGELQRVTSPDGQIEFRLFETLPPGESSLTGLAYQVSYRGKLLIDTSYLGIQIRYQDPLLGVNVGLLTAEKGSVDETYTVLAGKSKRVRNHYNWLRANYMQNGSQGRLVTIEVRAYDDGVAFRYVIPRSQPLTEALIESEDTEFEFAKDGDTYPLILQNFTTGYEDEYSHLTLTAIHPDSLIALPFLVNQPGIGWVAITEAGLDNYPGMYVKREDGRTFTTWLSPRPDDPSLLVDSPTPTQTPWRVLMIASTPLRLIESHIVENLNPPSAIADTSWIKPGKAAWNWWSGTADEDVDFKPGMNTATIEHYIDFAAASKFPYMMIDAGWAKAVGKSEPADITQTNPNIDMPAILAHAREKGVGVWLWAHWESIDRQMDQAFPLFQKWGIAGVKIDLMNRDDQWMVNFYRRAAKSAAEHHLMIDFHGAFKPDGLRRTYPNVITREAVMGLEYLKWSADTTPEHNVMLPFTRMLAGPMDYTPGGFDNVTRTAFEPRNKKPMVLGTRAHQLALYVVFDSPLMMVSDDPEAYKDQPAFEFIKDVPASWDDTNALNGEVGEYVTIARKSGEDWYLGSITNWTARSLDIPLDFLGKGDYIADIYADASDAGSHPKHTAIERKRVNSSMRLKLDLASGGGAAIRFHPAHSSSGLR